MDSQKKSKYCSLVSTIASATIRLLDDTSANGLEMISAGMKCGFLVQCNLLAFVEAALQAQIPHKYRHAVLA